jgi:hypothetical protein
LFASAEQEGERRSQFGEGQGGEEKRQLDKQVEESIWTAIFN